MRTAYMLVAPVSFSQAFASRKRHEVHFHPGLAVCTAGNLAIFNIFHAPCAAYIEVSIALRSISNRLRIISPSKLCFSCVGRLRKSRVSYAYGYNRSTQRSVSAVVPQSRNGRRLRQPIGGLPVPRCRIAFRSIWCHHRGQRTSGDGRQRDTKGTVGYRPSQQSRRGGGGASDYLEVNERQLWRSRTNTRTRPLRGYPAVEGERICHKGARKQHAEHHTKAARYVERPSSLERVESTGLQWG